MTAPDDRRLRTAIAVFDAVMNQSQLSGPQRDSLEVILVPSDDEASQRFRVTYTTTEVIAEMNIQQGTSSIRTGSSVKVEATIRLVRPANSADPIQMEIDGKTEPFDASDARVKLEGILSDKVLEILKAKRRR